GIGVFAVRRRWGPAAMLGLALGVWLLVMVVVMPITGAGVFGVDLFVGREAAVAGYLAAALVYGATLAWTTAAAERGERQIAATGATTSRRGAFALSGAAVVASLAAILNGERITGSESHLSLAVDPQEPVPSGGIDLGESHPQMASAAQPSEPPADEA